MRRSKIDILLPYWGDFSLLKETVESVITQTETNWKLSVFDDHYPSDEAAKYFTSLKDDRIVYYRHPKNIGVTKNFNYALQQATAEYCILIGCDDRMLPNYVKNALDKIGDSDFYQPLVEVIGGDGKVYLPLVDKIKRLLQPKRSGQYGGEPLAASLCNGNWLYFPSILWKTTAIQKYGFNPKYTIAQDVVLEMNILKQGGKLYFDRTTTFQYRRFAKSLSSAGISNGVRFDEENQVYEGLSGDFYAIGWKKAALSANLRITSRLHQLISRVK